MQSPWTVFNMTNRGVFAGCVSVCLSDGWAQGWDRRWHTAPPSRHRSAHSWRRKEERNKNPLLLLQGEMRVVNMHEPLCGEVIRKKKSKYAAIYKASLFPAAESSHFCRKMRSSVPRRPIILLNLSLGNTHLLNLIVWALWGLLHLTLKCC